MMFPTIFAVLIFIMLVLVILRRAQVYYSHVKFRHDMYVLRDELRLKAIKNEIDKNNWLFDYFDNTISKQIENTYYITTFFLLGSSFLHYKDAELEKFRDHLDRNLKLKDNEYYKKLNMRISITAYSHAVSQHSLSFSLFVRPIILPILKTFTTVIKMRKI